MDAGTWVKIGQFFLSLSILIIVHEWGHFFFAKLFKTRVTKFYLFFDFLFPLPKVLNFALFKRKKGETEYGIGWFPFGGYVQIEGMIDETQDAEKLKLPPQPWEFRSKPAWQRLLIMMGGIIVNLITALLIYSMVLFVWGEKKIVNNSLKDGIVVGDSLMLEIGLRNGDKVVSINNEPVKYFDDIPLKLLVGGKTVQVDRAGEQKSFAIREDILGALSSKKIDKKGLFSFRMPAIIDTFANPKESNAFKAGLRKGDKIVQLDSVKINYWDEIATHVNAAKDTATIAVTVDRNGQQFTYPVKINKDHMIGIAAITDVDELQKMKVFSIEEKKYSLLQSIPAGVNKAFGKLKDYIDQFALLFKPKTGAYKGMGGFASMSKVFGNTWDWESFWNITAFFSLALAFMNFLPIPMLDGGYILFTLIEIITGKKVPDSFLEKANMVGFFIIIGLMLFTNGNDVFRAITGKF